MAEVLLGWHCGWCGWTTASVMALVEHEQETHGDDPTWLASRVKDPEVQS